MLLLLIYLVDFCLATTCLEFVVTSPLDVFCWPSGAYSVLLSEDSMDSDFTATFCLTSLLCFVVLYF